MMRKTALSLFAWSARWLVVNGHHAPNSAVVIPTSGGQRMPLQQLLLGTALMLLAVAMLPTASYQVTYIGPAIRLGPYDMAPWNLTFFDDTSAEWIWSRALGNVDSPKNILTICWTELVCLEPTDIRIIAAVDDEAGISVNSDYVGAVAGWQYLNNSLPHQRLNVGPSFIQLQIRNTRGGPAGMLVSILTLEGTKLERSSSNTWECMEVDPTAQDLDVQPPPPPPPPPPPIIPSSLLPSNPPSPPPSPLPSAPSLPPAIPPPTIAPYVLQVFSGLDTMCARVAPAYQIKCWGENANGELGGTTNATYVPDMSPRSLPFINLGSHVGGVVNVTTFTGVARHFCAKLAGRFKCWGDNYFGQLGLLGANGPIENTNEDMFYGLGDKLPYIDIGADINTNDVIIGPSALSSTCLHVLSVGKIKCWGHNAHGQLGYGDTQHRNDPSTLTYNDLGTGQRVSSLAGGFFHMCAILQPSGGIKCWGNNAAGHLGYGDTDARGDNPGEMGDNLHFINLGTNLTASAVALGGWHTCVLLQPGASVKCWGDNNWGQLGYPGVFHRGGYGDAMGDTLPFVDLGSNITVTALVAGGRHTCALLSPGNRVKCWGFNYFGQLGLNDTSNRGLGAGSMGDKLPFVELGSTLQVAALTASAHGSCALLQPGGRVKCWGGITAEPRYGDGPDEMGDNLQFVNLEI